MRSIFKATCCQVNRFTVPGILVLFLFNVSCTVPEGSLADEKKYTNDDSQYRKKYDVDFQEDEKPIRYGYHYIVSKMPGRYRVRVFHPDKHTLIEDKACSTNALTLLHGPYKGYWDDGSIRAQGNYQFGRKFGTWLECEPGKGKSATGPYENNNKDGVWTQLDTSGLVESVYTWHEGKRHGKYFEFDTTGRKVNEGIYRLDTLISELHKRPVFSRPYLKSCQSATDIGWQACTEAKLNQLVIDKLKYPAMAKKMGIEGMVYIQWDVMPDGAVRNIRVPGALSNEIEAECLGVFRTMPEWSPALLEGKPVKWTILFPVNFSL